MSRLTARSPKNGMAYLVGVKPDEQALDGSYNTLKCVMAAFNRLAEYEEAGQQAVAEIERLRGENEKLKKAAWQAFITVESRDSALSDEYAECFNESIKAVEELGRLLTGLEG